MVEVVSGAARGRVVAGGLAYVWQGLPYAAPPVGALRFAAPSPVPPWTGVRDATAPGRAAVQPVEGRPGLKVWLGARRGRSEDCLTLNVWAPAEPAAARPVVVWIHGGGFNVGNGSDYDAGELAVRGDIVFVSINYRLGGFGFVDFSDALPGDERIASNPGVRDQIAALEWVRDNVAAFGGDPGQVTIAGESAGSAAVCAIATSRAARGLFHGVIAQSGALSLVVDREDAARTGREVLAEMGVSPDRIDQLWRLPAGAILAATVRCQERRTGALVTRPWWDDDILPATSADAYGEVAAVPMMIGTNADEHRTFTTLRRGIMPLTRAALGASLIDSFGPERTARILAEYPDTRDGLNDLGSDLVFTMPTVHLADRHAERAPVWRYRMDLQSWLPRMGAFHAIELMLLFPTDRRTETIFIGRPSDERDALAARWSEQWLAFVRDGRPTDVWPAYSVNAGRAVRVFNLKDHIEHDPHGARREVWAGGDATIH